jgi:hypothetical protein
MRSFGSGLKNIVGSSLLALAFLCVQQAAMLHWLSHSIEATRAKSGKAAPAVDQCDECLAFSAMGSAATSSDRVPVIEVGSPSLLLPAKQVASPAALRLAFRSRAPPILT